MPRRKKAPEEITVGGFIWICKPPRSNRERWKVKVPGIYVWVIDYGEDDQRGGYFRGWRIMNGAPLKEEYADRDEAMEAAREVIADEVRTRMAYAIEVTEKKQPFAGVVRERTRRAMETCRVAGIEL